MKKTLALILALSFLMVLVASPAMAISAEELEGIEVPAAPAEVPEDVELVTPTEGMTLRSGDCCCFPIVKTGPCCIKSCDATFDMWHNNDEQSAGFCVPVFVDIVHSLEVGLYDGAGAPKCDFYLGNTSPVEGYRDPAGKDGTDSGVLVIKSNDEYQKAVWASEALMPIMCDDAGGRAWDAHGTGLATPLKIKLYVDGADCAGNYFVSGAYAVPPNCVTAEKITLSIGKPDWQNEAGEYAGYLCVAVWQL